MKQEQLFIDYIEQSIIQNWDRNALTDYQGITLQYKDVARKIAKFHIVLESAGIQPGDKIAVCGRNSAHWAVCFGNSDLWCCNRSYSSRIQGRQHT